MAEGALYRVTADGLVAAVVRTPAGAKRYGQPIGSVIVPDIVPQVAKRAVRAVTVPAPHKGRVPSSAEVSAAVRKIDSGSTEMVRRRGMFKSAAYLDVAGYNEPPTVLPTRAFDAFKGKTITNYNYGSEELSEFWRGTVPSKLGIDPYTNLTTAEPTDYYVGYGLYANGTHIGDARSASKFADIAGHRIPKTSRRFSDGSSMVRIKIHPDARVGKYSDIGQSTSMSAVEWAVENGYDVLDLSSTQDPVSGIVVLNRSVIVVEEIEDENGGRVASAGAPGESGPDVSAGGSGDSGLAATAAGLPAEGRGDLPAALGTLDPTLTAAIVRTPAGAKKYGQPIGSVIVRDVPLDPAVVEIAKNLPATGSLPVGTVTQTENRLRPLSERTVGAEDPAAWADYPLEAVAGDRGGYRWVERDTDQEAGRTLGSEQQQIVVVKILDELADEFPIVRNTAIYSETGPENFGQAEGTYIYSGEPSTARLDINFAVTEEILRKQGIVVDEIPEDRLYTAVSTTYDDAQRAMVVHETAHSLEKSLLHLTSKKGRRRTKTEQAYLDAKAAFDAWVAARVTEPLRAHGHDRSWYATENVHEWIAEAFADGYLNRDNPSPEGKIVYDFYASIFGSDPPQPQEFRP